MSIVETERKPQGFWDDKENCRKYIELCDNNLSVFH